MANIWKYANPQAFEDLARPITPWLWGATAALFAVGIYLALFGSPADYQQGESVRIMYVHVPAAWMSMFVYASMAAASVLSFVWRHPLADIAAKSAAPLGAMFTVLALATGALWGKPMWGTWWAWDARLTSVLVLLFLYLGYMALWSAIEDETRAARVAAIVAMVGAVNLPIIKFSVDWWNTLHQPASVMRLDGPTIHGDMLVPLLVMGLAYMMLFAALLATRMRTEIMTRRLARLQREAAANA